MNITIRTNLLTFGYHLAQTFEEQGCEKVLVFPTDQEDFLLLHGPHVETRQVCSFLESLNPFKLTPSLAEGQEEDFQIVLGFPRVVEELEVELHGDSKGIVEKLNKEFAVPLGARVLCSEHKVITKNTLTHQGLHPSVVQLLTWQLQQSGIEVFVQEIPKVGTTEFSFDDTPVDEAESSTESMSAIIKVKDPEQEAIPFRERMPVHLFTDSEADGEALDEKLRAAGFMVAEISPLIPDEAEEVKVEINTAWNDQSEAQKDLAEIQKIVREFLLGSAFDLERYPVCRTGAGENPFTLNINLPLAACRDGRRRAYAGSFPERFKVCLYIDDDPLPWIKRLEVAGFTSVEVKEFDSDDLRKGFRVVAKGGKEAPQILPLLKGVIAEGMQAIGADSVDGLSIDDEAFLDDPVFNVHLPVRALQDGSLEEAITSPQHYDLKIHCHDPEPWEEVISELQEWSFSEFCVDLEERSPGIHYGGAPKPLIEKIQKLFVEKYDVLLSTKKRWSDTDDDIWVFLPKKETRQLKETQTVAGYAPSAIEEWLHATNCNLSADQGKDCGAFLEKMDGHLAVGDLLLECVEGPKHRLVPNRKELIHYCVDSKSADLLHHLATSVLLREPCLLEGETGVSKTTSIQYLAMLLDQPVVRLNLSQQTDTGDLLGRLMPDTQRGQKHAAGNGNIDNDEIGYQKGSSEASHSIDWRWQDGLLVQAMVKGWWFIFDEINLWPPAVAEGINSVLEKHPSLVLKEFDNAVIGSGGVPVHPRFRVFGTMNPAAYSGRSRLSPAFKDRWVGYSFVDIPGEAEYLAMLRLLVFGQHPDLPVGGFNYKGAQNEPVFPGLAKIKGIDNILELLARLHAALERAARPGADRQGLGQGGKEGYTVTRRGLFEIVEYMATPSVSGGTPNGRLRHALHRYYIKRAQPKDQNLVVQILDSVGLGPTTCAV